MRIKKFGGLSGVQIGLAIFVGVSSGYYMWKPYFEDIKKIADEERAKQAKPKAG